MSTAESFHLISVDDYLQGELESDVRHEYKREAYFHLPSLKYYILLEQHSIGCVYYRRDGDQWERSIHTDPDSGFHVSEIEASLGFRDVYAGVEF